MRENTSIFPCMDTIILIVLCFIGVTVLIWMINFTCKFIHPHIETRNDYCAVYIWRGRGLICNMFSVYILKGEIVINDLSFLEGHFVVCCIGWCKWLSLHLRLPFKCNPPEIWFWKNGGRVGGGGGRSWMVAWTEGWVVFTSEDSLLLCEHLLSTSSPDEP